MTGEMSCVDPNEYPEHAAVAAALGGELRPFDVYLGPYIHVPEGWVFLDGEGVCLWPQGMAPAYCEPVVVEVGWPRVEDYILAARAAVTQARERAVPS